MRRQEWKIQPQAWKTKRAQAIDGGKSPTPALRAAVRQKAFPSIKPQRNRHKRDTLLSPAPGVPSPACSLFIFLYPTFFVWRRPPFYITDYTMQNPCRGGHPGSETRLVAGSVAQ